MAPPTVRNFPTARIWQAKDYTSDVLQIVDPGDVILAYIDNNGIYHSASGAGTIGGSIADTQVAVGNGTNSISGSPSLTFSGGILNVPGGTVSAGLIQSLANVTANGVFGSSAINGAAGLILQGTLAATAIANVSSGDIQLFGTAWNGSASVIDGWTIQDVVGTGTNPTSTLTFLHAGSNTGISAVSLPLVEITSSPSGTAHPATASIIFDPLSTFPTYMTHDGTQGAFTIRNDNLLINSHGLLSWGATGMIMDGGSNSPSFHMYEGAPSAGYVGIPNQSAQFDFVGPGALAITTNPGTGNRGEIIIAPLTDLITFYGNTSGNAAIGVNVVAGTPNPLLLPTTTGPTGWTLVTDGGNPQQLSWVSGSVTVASGTVALGTTLIASGAKSSIITVSAPGTTTLDRVQADFNVDPSAITGYAPSASGMLTIVKFCTPDHVNFYVYNNTALGITPGAVSLNWGVVR